MLFWLILSEKQKWNWSAFKIWTFFLFKQGVYKWKRINTTVTSRKLLIYFQSDWSISKHQRGFSFPIKWWNPDKLEFLFTETFFSTFHLLTSFLEFENLTYFKFNELTVWSIQIDFHNAFGIKNTENWRSYVNLMGCCGVNLGVKLNTFLIY